MYFKNKKHEHRFAKAVIDNNVNLDNREMVAVIYLLTYSKKIWNRFKDHVSSDEIELWTYPQENDDLVDGAIQKAAYDLYYYSSIIGLCELADKDDVPEKAFNTILCAICFLRYGCCMEDVYDSEDAHE